MAPVQLKLVSSEEKHKTSSSLYSRKYPSATILSIVILFTIRVLRALWELPSYILIYIWPWISQTHNSLFSFLSCHPTPLFFTFPYPYFLPHFLRFLLFPSKWSCMGLTLEALSAFSIDWCFSAVLGSKEIYSYNSLTSCQLQNEAQFSNRAVQDTRPEQLKPLP